MGQIIAVNGKGGTGKTTVASLIVASLVKKRPGRAILAIDADPNSCLAEALGVRGPDSIVATCEAISKNMDRMPAGVTKDRYIEMRVQEALVEKDGFDLLVMGRPEGPGCYCYVNNLLRGLIGRITKDYDYIVMDNAAGMEHISRRTASEVNNLLIVSDYSASGVRSAKRIYDLAKELGIKIGKAYLVVNKVSGPLGALGGEIEATGLTLAGELPYMDEIVEWNLLSRPVFELGNGVIMKNIDGIIEKMEGERHANRAC